MHSQPMFDLDLLPSPDLCYWLSGLADGEASFIASLKQRPPTQNCKNDFLELATEFRIGLRDDDDAILEKIHQVLKVGTIVRTGARPRSKPFATYIVYRMLDCLYVIVPLFMKYPLRTKKKQDFDIWSRCVHLRHEYSLCLSGQEQILKKYQEECDRLKDTRKYKGKGEQNANRNC